jgi:hypothetical protein
MRCRSFTICALTALTMSVLLPVSAKATSCPPQVSPALATADSAPYKVSDGYPAGVLGPNIAYRAGGETASGLQPIGHTALN